MKKWIAIAAAAILAISLAACSGNAASDDDNSSETAATTVEIVASNFSFDQEVYTVKQGEPVKITLKNAKGLHGIEIDGLKVNLTNGKSKIITPTEPGTYTIRCNIRCGEGHSEMIASLVVE